MKKKFVLLSVLVLEMVSAALLQVKTPVHAQTSLKGISVQVAEGGGTEKTEAKRV